ncbi:Lead, cadmium, zinc and mercury transporting ATPase, partial [Salmonella enterica subsp. enterica serovar Minnesota str. A4-603]
MLKDNQKHNESVAPNSAFLSELQRALPEFFTADRYMHEISVDISGFATTAERLGQEGKSPLYAAIDGQLAAIIAVADPIKPSTPAAINALHQLGIKVAMITGDNARTAQAIARQLGIDDVVAEVLPEGKVEAIRRLKAAYGQVAFVGDGINDARFISIDDNEYA